MREAVTIDENEKIIDAFYKMKENNVKELVVVNKQGEYKGLIRERDIILEKNLNAKVKNIVKIFAKTEKEDISEIAKIMYQNDLYTLPYVKNKEVLGIFYIDEILEYIQKNVDLKNIPAYTIMTKKVIVASPQIKISKVIRIFAENNISHLPLVENSKLVAIVSRRDIIEKIFKPKERVTIGELIGEKYSLLENPAISIASKPVITFYKKEKIGTLIERMKENNISCLVEKNLEGIITKKDFLKVLIEERLEGIKINVSGLAFLDSLEKNLLNKYAKSFCNEIKKIGGKELEINVKKLSEKRNYFVIRATCLIKDSYIHASAEGFNFIDVLQTLFDKLKRLAIEEKGYEEEKNLREIRKSLLIEYLKNF